MDCLYCQRWNLSVLALKRTHTHTHLPSAPNFLGEIIEWAGFSVAAGGTWATLAFAVFVFGNLAPRAHHHHQWYLEKFKEAYPRDRKSLIPFLW